jgi:hypothetical protein
MNGTGAVRSVCAKCNANSAKKSREKKKKSTKKSTKKTKAARLDKNLLETVPEPYDKNSNETRADKDVQTEAVPEPAPPAPNVVVAPMPTFNAATRFQAAIAVLCGIHLSHGRFRNIVENMGFMRTEAGIYSKMDYVTSDYLRKDTFVQITCFVDKEKAEPGPLNLNSTSTDSNAEWISGREKNEDTVSVKSEEAEKRISDMLTKYNSEEALIISNWKSRSNNCIGEAH